MLGGFEELDEKTLKLFKQDEEFHVPLKEPWFSYIKEGKKTIEGRINKG